MSNPVLTIRNAQLQVLAGIAMKSFTRRAKAHLQNVVPERCAQLGEAAVLESIETAVRKARSYGLRNELEILRYLNLMYLLGFDFDSDSRYSWVQEILSDTSLKPQTKALQLWTRAREQPAQAQAATGG